MADKHNIPKGKMHSNCRLLPEDIVCKITSDIQIQIQNPFLTAQSTQIKSVISVPIKDFIHHYPRALFNDIPMVGAHFYDIPGSGRTFTTYPGRDALLRHTRVGTHFYDIPGSGRIQYKQKTQTNIWKEHLDAH